MAKLLLTESSRWKAYVLYLPLTSVIMGNLQLQQTILYTKKGKKKKE